MSNIEIISNTNIIEVIFNDLVAVTGFVKATCSKNTTSIALLPSAIRIYINGQDFMDVALVNSVGVCGIDSVDSVEPTDLNDLYERLKVLIA